MNIHPAICAPMNPASCVTISQAIPLLISAKKLANRRQRYLKSLEQFLKLFARGREDIPLHEVGLEHIEGWLACRNDKPTTRSGNIGRLSSLFSFAYRRRWIAENPCDRIEKITLEPSAPRILSPEQAEALMRWSQFQRPDSVGYFARTLFAGVRPEETERLPSTAFDGKRLTVEAEASKVRNRRIIDLHPTAIGWFKEGKRLGCLGPISRPTRQRFLRDAREHLGLPAWPQDILRHSAASYLMAIHRDAGKVADMLGNSPSILLRHYRNLVTDDQAKAFWNIQP